MDVREVTPQELRERNEKSWKETQNIFRRRLREIAAGGENKAKYKVDDYCLGERIQPWLESLGFKVKQVGLSWCEVTWSEQKTIAFGSQNVGYSDLKRFDAEREWVFDSRSYDFVCTGCGKHSWYNTSYCPNCGKKMKEEKENK